MKKILSLIGALSLTATSATSILAMYPISYRINKDTSLEKNSELKDQSIKLIDNINLNQYVTSWNSTNKKSNQLMSSIELNDGQSFNAQFLPTIKTLKINGEFIFGLYNNTKVVNELTLEKDEDLSTNTKLVFKTVVEHNYTNDWWNEVSRIASIVTFIHDDQQNKLSIKLDALVYVYGNSSQFIPFTSASYQSISLD